MKTEDLRQDFEAQIIMLKNEIERLKEKPEERKETTMCEEKEKTDSETEDIAQRQEEASKSSEERTEKRQGRRGRKMDLSEQRTEKRQGRRGRKAAAAALAAAEKMNLSRIDLPPEECGVGDETTSTDSNPWTTMATSSQTATHPRERWTTTRRVIEWEWPQYGSPWTCGRCDAQWCRIRQPPNRPPDGVMIPATASELESLKRRTRCSFCGETGHWKGDPECPGRHRA